MSVNPIDLTTLENVKTYMSSVGGVTPADDAMLSRLITAASQSVRNWTGRDFKSQSYIETRNGNGKPRLTLLQFPVTAVASVVINTVAIPAAVDPLHYGYQFDETTVYLNGYSAAGQPFTTTDNGQWFSKGTQNVVVRYTAGYTAGDAHLADIEQAVIDLVVLWHYERKRIGQASASLGPEHISFIVNEPAAARTMRVLDQTKRRFVPT